MAKVESVYLEIKDSIIIAFHSDNVDTSNLPAGHTIQLENIEDPNSILGLNVTFIDKPVADRPKLYDIPAIDLKRSELKSVSIELDLATRLGEDTTALDAQWITLKNEYDALKPT